jgi:hypothetical protein
VGVRRHRTDLVLTLARLDSRRMAPAARGRDARPGCSGVWRGGMEVALHRMVARREAKRRARCEREEEEGVADLLHDREDNGVEESARGAVVTGGLRSPSHNRSHDGNRRELLSGGG